MTTERAKHNNLVQLSPTSGAALDISNAASAFRISVLAHVAASLSQLAVGGGGGASALAAAVSRSVLALLPLLCRLLFTWIA